MIPKSLILSFLALQPGMSPAPGAKDAVVFSGVPSTAQEVFAFGGSENAVSGWGVDTAASKYIDVRIRILLSLFCATYLPPTSPLPQPIACSLALFVLKYRRQCFFLLTLSGILRP